MTGRRKGRLAVLGACALFAAVLCTALPAIGVGGGQRDGQPPWMFDALSVSGADDVEAFSHCEFEEDVAGEVPCLWVSADTRLVVDQDVPFALVARYERQPSPSPSDFSGRQRELAVDADELQESGQKLVVYAFANERCVFRSGTSEEHAIEQGSIVKLLEVCYAQQPRVLVAYEPSQEGQPGVFGTARTAVVTVEDGRLQELLASLDEDEKETRTVMSFECTAYDGTVTSIPVTLAMLEGTPVPNAARVELSDEGRYRVVDAEGTPAYQTTVPVDAAWADGSDLEPFSIDKTNPEAGAAVVSPVSYVTDDGELFSERTSTVAFSLSDGQSGIDPGSVRLTSNGIVQTLAFVADEGGASGVATWYPPDVPGTRIDLSAVSLAFSDRAGHEVTIGNLAEYEQLQGEDGKRLEGVTSYYPNVVQPDAVVTFDNNDVRNGMCYNAPRTATVTIDDFTFPWVRLLFGERAVVTATHDGAAVTYCTEDFTNASGDGRTWTCTVPCTQDGTWRLDVSFTNLIGLKTTQQHEFVVDTVPPEVGKLEISPERVQQWGWLFVQGDAALRVGLTDATSGIDAQAVQVAEPAGTHALVVEDGGQTSGTDVSAVWDVAAEDRAIALSDMELSVADKAGNAAAPVRLSEIEDCNIDVEGVFADGTAPVLSVGYDNDDAENGRYYDAPRTAAVTLSEASFGFVRENDPYRVIATRTRDGNELQIRARDFENPSGDGVTWVAQVPCKDDGDYRIRASFADPSGRTAAPYDSGLFTVDTTVPVIYVNFDNNDASNGEYYKAPRTATITVRERNFSPALAPVTVTAADAAGNAVAAPSPSPWCQQQDESWVARVSFNGELHYTLRVECSDLAGNVARTVEVPEFVIDMTAPVVSITRVSQGGAYGNEVAPLVSFSDTNFEPALCQVIMSGANRGDAVFFAAEDSETATSRTVDYEDFPYELENDDVYTMTATISDLAGNQARAQVTFSVNRFGSNYILSDETAGYVDTCLDRPKDFVVTEVNVSGLEASRVALAENDGVRMLEPGKDYQVADTGGGASWTHRTYTLPASLFEDDGYYRVLLSSDDRAGNLSENLMDGKNADRTAPLEMKFAVDQSAPLARLGNVASGQSFYAPGKELDLYVSDNLGADKAMLYVNGEPVAQWGADEVAAQGVLTYTLPASDSAQEVRLEVVDRAGNVASSTATGVVVTNNLLFYILNTPAILYPLIAAAILLVGGVCIGIPHARRAYRRRRERFARLREGR